MFDVTHPHFESRKLLHNIIKADVLWCHWQPGIPLSSPIVVPGFLERPLGHDEVNKRWRPKKTRTPHIPPSTTLSLPVRRPSQVGIDLSQRQTAVDSQVVLKVIIDFQNLCKVMLMFQFFAIRSTLISYFR